MIKDILQIILIFVIPYLIIRFKDFKLTKIFGTIGMAYFFGLVVAGIVFAVNKANIEFHLNTDIGEIGSYAAIAIGIPLLLFGSNLQEAKKLSKMVLKSFGALIVSVIFVSTLVFIFFGKNLIDGDALSAAAIGLYTGGTPNLNAITNIFGLDTEVIALANLSDIIIGAVFYIFLLLLAKPLIDKILKPSKSDTYLKEESNMKNTEDFNVKDFKTSKRLFTSFLIAFAMTAISAGVGILIWILAGSVQGRMLDFLVPVMLIGVTVFGIIGSFNKKIRETEGTNILGHYLVLVFSFALASSVDFSRLIGSNFGDLIILYGIITVGSFIVHLGLAKILKIDSDCMIVTATAGIYGPAFVPAITKQLKNDNLTVPGLICGSIGYALGTFIGVGLGLLFSLGM
ncbi:DUF819 family protein [Candidatus Izemoplasma sp. B36]|uniref:DUF819 family protein n=1 Tax=Candidatus Izemoplasma sp. B36 TaxID=3242468 RepID=UPI0035577FA0